MGNSTFFTSPKQLKISTTCSLVTFRVSRPTWMRSGRGVTERSRRFLPASFFPAEPSRGERPRFSLFFSTDVRRFSSRSTLRLRGLRSRERERPRRSSPFRLLEDFSFSALLPGDTDLRFVRDRSLELDEDDELEDDELDELEPELLLREDELELKVKAVSFEVNFPGGRKRLAGALVPAGVGAARVAAALLALAITLAGTGAALGVFSVLLSFGRHFQNTDGFTEIPL